jgi:hypothetical protein
MTGERVKCPTSDLWGDRHFVTTRRWLLTTPEDLETVLCSAACTLFWITYAILADVEAAHSGTPAEGEAA